MHRQRANSPIAISFRNASNFHTLGRKSSKVYGYLELNDGVLEISKFKNTGKLNIELRVMRAGDIKPELGKIVSSYSEVRQYVRDLNYEDMSPLKSLLTDIS